MNSEAKRRIDAARQILVGKIPDPKGQVQEITNALVYKFMDDMDEMTASIGGKRRYFTDEYEKYSWRTIMSPKVGAHERIDLYTQALRNLSINKNLPELFRGIFRNAYLPFNDGRTLTLFLKEIDYFNYKNSEDLGNAYEYLLSIMGSQGDAGQFRTPRHIIDFIVEVIHPTKDDSVLDPACGTAGFLISAYKHVMRQHDGKDDEGNPKPEEIPLNADEKKMLHQNYRGFDIDDNMVKIAQVNMYLHSFPNPNILVHDTLSSENYWQDRYDVILANPPFMTPKGGSMPHNKFAIQSTRSEVLFVDYIMSHLKPHGRAGIIVPEGIIFQSGKAHKQLREKLVKDGLYSVISLPSGVFQPYSGVKTSILLFDNELAKQRNEIIFVCIKNTGFSLTMAQRETYGNDIPQSIEIINQFKEGHQITPTRLAFTKSKKAILAKGCDLTLSKYAPSISTGNKRMVSLSEVCDIRKGKSSSTKTEPGPYPLILTAEEPKTASHYDFEGEGVAIPLISSTGHGKASIKRIHLINGKFALANLLAFLRPLNITKANSKYLYYVLDSAKDAMAGLMQGAANVSMKTSDIAEFQIPLPPLEIQEQIAAELDGYQKIINGARQIVSSWKPSFTQDSNWIPQKLSDLTDYQEGPGIMAVDFRKAGVPLIRLKGLANNIASLYGCNFLDPKKVEKKWSHFKLKLGDLLLSTSGSLGKVSEVGPELVGCVAYTGIIRFRPKNNKIETGFLKYFLMSEYFTNQALSASTGVTLKHFGPTHLNKMEIMAPSLEIQKQIVEKIEAERALVDSAKKLIEIYEQKTKDSVEKLWEG
jgi:type I restriction enzyme M protein